MNQSKLLKLLGVSLIIGIMGFLGSCQKKKDNNNEALLLGTALVVQQQAEEAALNSPNPNFFCAQITKSTQTSFYASLFPLSSNDCTADGLKEMNKAVKDVVNDELNESDCDSTEESNIISYIDTLKNSFNSSNIKYVFVPDKSLKQEVNVSYDISSLEVVSVNTYKNVWKYLYLHSIAKSLCGSACGVTGNPYIDAACYNAIKTFVENKVANINDYCLISSTGCIKYDGTTGGTKVYGGSCIYGSGYPSGSNVCASLNDQF